MYGTINVVVQNGLGVASFVALIIYIFEYENKQNDILEKISSTLTLLTARVDKIEEKINKGE